MYTTRLSRPLILASASPRRAELLMQIGLDFTVVPSHCPELPPAPREDVAAWAQDIALEKARATAQMLPATPALVLAADTVVVLSAEGEICGPLLHGRPVIVLGKPLGAAEAISMLRKLSARTHTVLTAFAMLAHPEGETSIDLVATEVNFRELSDYEITEYVATGEPLDKAGAYGIQGRGATLVDSIAGDYYNVVGLPLARLWTRLLPWLIAK